MTRTSAYNRWSHRLAWALVGVVFPLVWMGGLVTTYDAGMAVPDWPSTFGHWLIYPMEAGLAWWDDVFMEHTHRILGASAGLLTIALATVLWRRDPRPAMRWLGVAAVAAVSFQGLLGGLRVIGDRRLLANVHGCTAPLFFALCAAMVTLTSRAWTDKPASKSYEATRLWRALALATTVGVHIQIVLGAQLRHLPTDGRTGLGWSVLWVWLHLIWAAVVAVVVIVLLLWATRRLRDRPRIVARARWLCGLFFLQAVLGAATWVTNYGWPAWFTDSIWEIEYTVVAQGRLQALCTTAHVAVGSLNLVFAVGLTLWSFRLLNSDRPA